MEIWVVTSDTPPATVYLCSDSDQAVGAGPSDLVISGQRVSQDALRFRAAHRKTLNRKNRGHSITFTVHRLHDSESEAAAHILDHNEDVPEQGEVHFREEMGNNVIERVMSDAMITNTEARWIGRTTRHTYQVVGGALEVQQTVPES